VPPQGDYFAVKSLSRFNGISDQNDVIIRNQSATAAGWHAVTAEMPPGTIGSLQVADGGSAIYILTANDNFGLVAAGSAGKVARAVGSPPGRWELRSNGLNQAFSLAVDPFNGSVLYATDLGDPARLDDDRIMRSENSGREWSQDVQLTRIALGGGRFRMACGNGVAAQVAPGFPNFSTAGGGGGGFRFQCTLAAMAFDPADFRRRWAVLDPAGVAFSRDGGNTWKALRVTLPMDRPTGAFYDPTPNPKTGQGSLYVALHGRGLIRVDARWPQL
jgi:hypothetical protein